MDAPLALELSAPVPDNTPFIEAIYTTRLFFQVKILRH